MIQYSDEWLWFTLALALGGRTVQEWQAVISENEFRRWGQFYKDYPFDDFHRFYRPAAMVAQSMGGGTMKDKLDWLQPEAIPEGMSAADIATIKAMGFPLSRKE